MGKRVAGICFFLFLGLVTLLLTEAAYRVYLRHTLYASIAAATKEEPEPSFSFWAYPAPWRYDRDLGFMFNDGGWLGGNIDKGAFTRCATSGAGNRYGNFGQVRGDYRAAELKILFFGSSYTLMDADGTGDTATNLLQEALARQLGKTVHVLNYSRDSIGVLSMFDMARARIEIDKPDLVIFGFNTLGLIFPRSWRFVKESSPGLFRVYQSIAPIDQIEKDDAILNLQVISNRVNKAWCDELGQAAAAGDRQKLRGDPLVVELVREYNAIRREQTAPQISLSFFTLETSFVYRTIRYGDPYHKLLIYKPKTVYAPVSIDSYADDKGFVDAVAELKRTRVPFVLVHLPALPDLKQPGRIALEETSIPLEPAKAQIRSIEELTGEKLVPLTSYYDQRDLANPARMVVSEQDHHPNDKGTRAVAAALLKLLVERGLVK